MAPRRRELTPEEKEREIARIRMPKKGELFGVVTEVLGAGKMRVECEDGLTRLGRIRGKMRKRVWVRLGDLVIIMPWKVQSDEKGDIIWRYTRTQANWIKKKGHLKNLDWE